MITAGPAPILRDHGALSAVLPPERRVAVLPGRLAGKQLRFAFDDGEVRTVRHFAWFEEAHVVYIDGADIIERCGRRFWLLRCTGHQEAHDRFYDIMTALEDAA